MSFSLYIFFRSLVHNRLGMFMLLVQLPSDVIFFVSKQLHVCKKHSKLEMGAWPLNFIGYSIHIV